MRVPAFIETVRARLAARAAALGVSATMLAVAGFVVSLIALPLIAKSYFWAGLAALLLGRVLAFIGETPQTSELSHAFALIALACIVFAFALADPSRAVAACFLLFGFVAAAAVWRVAAAEQAGATLVFAVACITPAWFSLIAYGLGIICFAMAGMRLATRT